ncbi:MAG: hypothetical protein WCF95_05135 [bacterium]
MKKNFLERNKKLLVLVLCSICLTGPVCAQSVDGLFQKGVEEYRKGNSQECVEIMKTLEKKDPSNAYVEYYLAMSEAKLGHLNEAKDKYEQVILLNQDEQLVSYSKEGIKNIEKVQGKDDVAVVKDKKTSKIIDKPALKPESELKKAQKNSVSDDEVAKAIKVLREAGLLNVQVGVNGGSPSASTPAVDSEIMKQNAEMMQMNMMMSSMGGGSKNSSMDMLPLLMMQQQQGNNGGKSAISPEIIQMMMNNTMLEGLNGLDSNDKDK